ncbi:MAG: aminopeptidase [Gammaproteobacteria bacterium]
MLALMALRRIVIVSLMLLAATGCSTVQYYGQAVSGHLEIMGASRPLEQVIEDPSTEERVRERLRLAAEARRFASRELSLPDNRSYTRYADLGRGAVVWALYAAPEFDTAPHRWCYPLVGCLAYRGYFDQAEAMREAKKLASLGMDTHVAPVPAYSTLGWFADPLLNTMMAWDDEVVAALIFHELAHQVVYVPGDTEFNEAFAVAVEREGMRRWLAASGRSDRLEAWLARKSSAARFTRSLLALRAELTRLYARPLSAQSMRAAKAAAMERARSDFRQRLRERPGERAFTHWYGAGLNNARLNVLAVYERWVPAFEQLLEREDRDLERFYREVRRLGGLQPDERARRLRALDTP